MLVQVADDTRVAQREANEDSSLSVSLPPGESPWGFRAVVAVADGMGGHNAGDVASGIAIAAVEEVVVARGGVPAEAGLQAGSAPGEVVAQAVRVASARICDRAAGALDLAEMGTTLTIAALLDDTAVIAHVGDSRAWRVTAAGIEQLTQDHSWVAEQVRAGAMTPEEARRSPLRHQITRTVGTSRTVEPDVLEIEVREGEVILVSSDGLSECLSDQEVHRIIVGSADVADACTRLLDAAVAAGAHDNVTVAAMALGPFLAPVGAATSERPAAAEPDSAPEAPAEEAPPAAAEPQAPPEPAEQPVMAEPAAAPAEPLPVEPPAPPESAEQPVMAEPPAAPAQPLPPEPPARPEAPEAAGRSPSRQAIIALGALLLIVAAGAALIFAWPTLHGRPAPPPDETAIIEAPTGLDGLAPEEPGVPAAEEAAEETPAPEPPITLASLTITLERPTLTVAVADPTAAAITAVDPQPGFNAALSDAGAVEYAFRNWPNSGPPLQEGRAWLEFTLRSGPEDAAAEEPITWRAGDGDLDLPPGTWRCAYNSHAREQPLALFDFTLATGGD